MRTGGDGREWGGGAKITALRAGWLKYDTMKMSRPGGSGSAQQCDRSVPQEGEELMRRVDAAAQLRRSSEATESLRSFHMKSVVKSSNSVSFSGLTNQRSSDGVRGGAVTGSQSS